MRTSAAGIELIKRFEGCRLEAYLCPAGVPTIGYGSTHGVQLGQTLADQAEAERRLREIDLPKFEVEVEDAIHPELGTAPVPTQAQFDAMVSLCFNIGGASFRQSSVLRNFLRGEFKAAADSFLLWDKGRVDGVLRPITGLKKRRQAERQLFLSQSFGVQSV